MIVEYVRYAIPADRREQFEHGYERARASLDLSPHCLAYELSRCVEDPTQYILRIEWDSSDGHIAGFRRTAEFQSFFSAIGRFADDIAEMRTYEPTAVSARKPAPLA